MPLPRRVRLALPALTILAVAAMIAQLAPGEDDTVVRDGLTFAAGKLDGDLNSNAKPLETRIIADFQRDPGSRCRAFLNPRLSGIACRRDGRWHLAVIRDGVAIDDPGGAGQIERGLREAVEGMRAQ